MEIIHFSSQLLNLISTHAAWKVMCHNMDYELSRAFYNYSYSNTAQVGVHHAKY